LTYLIYLLETIKRQKHVPMELTAAKTARTTMSLKIILFEKLKAESIVLCSLLNDFFHLKPHARTYDAFVHTYHESRVVLKSCQLQRGTSDLLRGLKKLFPRLCFTPKLPLNSILTSRPRVSLGAQLASVANKSNLVLAQSTLTLIVCSCQ